MWRRIITQMQNNKFWQLIYMVACMVILISIYIPTLDTIKEKRFVKHMTDLSAKVNLDFWYGFNEIEVNKKDIIVSGWIANENYKNVSTVIVLKSEEKQHIIETELREYTSLEDDYFFGEEKEVNTFFGNISTNKIKPEVCYEIHLVIEYEDNTRNDISGPETTRKKIKTNRYLYNGTIYNYNPQNKVLPSVSNEFALSVLSEASLMWCDAEHEFWLYKYNNELIYIVGSKFGDLNETNIRIPVMLYTTRKELLPDNRIEHGYDSLGAYQGNIEDAYYLIMKIELPDYPITYINTGLHDYGKREWVYHVYVPFME